ncbi:MAG: vanadium-dependent haloperoxidase [Pseudobdellovibrionaceae bacterium]|nr:vanadium-dependent haloperoxidase [Pseudobdellovibrionaceae bacterium]
MEMKSYQGGMMKHVLMSLGLVSFLWTGPGLRAQTAELIHQSANPEPTAAYRWLDILLETSAREVDKVGARPTILARSMAIVETAMFDAWAAYDAKAVGTRYGDQLRRPEKERTQKNKEIAIAYAAYRTLLNIYADDQEWVRGQMKKMGYDPDNNSSDRTKPEGIGNVVASAVLQYRHHDGANQLGDEPGSSGKPYSDYTYYRSVNKPDALQNPTLWMPIAFKNKEGKNFSPNFLTAHWYRVKPFALESASQFRSPPPPEWGSKLLEKEIAECAEVNANLSLEQKAVVEFMRDGPRSTGQSGHWLRFAQDVSRRDKNDLDKDVKMFFAVANVVHDTFVSSWDTKRFYDTSRPYHWVRQQYAKKQLVAWKGPGQGFGKIPGEKWHPYSPDGFVTPPFPGYVSGHATASAGAARILEFITGSEKFGAVAIRQAGELTEENFTTAQMQARDGKPAKDAPASKEVRLALPTFMATAEMAAISRMWGGYHIRTDNEEGLIMGKKIAEYTWPKYQAYFEGKALVAH